MEVIKAVHMDIMAIRTLTNNNKVIPTRMKPVLAST